MKSTPKTQTRHYLHKQGNTYPLLKRDAIGVIIQSNDFYLHFK